jgi:ABC-type amino acid transport substrate-binding protein
VTIKGIEIVGELYSDNVYIFTLKPNKSIKHFEDIPKLGVVGMIAGGPFIDFAIKYGFEHKLETSYNGERTVEKLKLNRIDGLVISGLLGKYKLENAGISKNIYQPGISIGKINWLIGTNKKTNDPNINKLSEALRDFRATEKYQKILNKYFNKFK